MPDLNPNGESAVAVVLENQDRPAPHPLAASLLAAFPRREQM